MVLQNFEVLWLSNLQFSLSLLTLLMVDLRHFDVKSSENNTLQLVVLVGIGKLPLHLHLDFEKTPWAVYGTAYSDLYGGCSGWTAWKQQEALTHCFPGQQLNPKKFQSLLLQAPRSSFLGCQNPFCQNHELWKGLLFVPGTVTVLDKLFYTSHLAISTVHKNSLLIPG
jgi:hypothetical protein